MPARRMLNIDSVEIFKEIGKIEIFDPFFLKKKTAIIDIRKRLLCDIEKARRWHSDRIFCRLVDEFTMRAAKGKTGSKLFTFFRSHPNVNIFNLSKSEFLRIFKGKRFAGNDAQVALDCRKIFLNRYAGDWGKYFDEAEKLRGKNNFEDDPFLKIKGIGFKTRDLGLESFSKDFIAIDVHIRRTLFRTGLIAKGFQYGLELPSGANYNKDYINFISICRKISEEAKISLMEMDKSLWYFGEKICGNEPKCNQCPLFNKNLCAFKRGV